MENNQQDYRTFRFYDEKGRRLSIFAVPSSFHMPLPDDDSVELGKLVDGLTIYVFTCSKKDTFSKKKARQLYEDYITTPETELSHPEIYIIPIQDNKPKWSFLIWCRENFFKLLPYTFAIQGNVLTRGQDALNFVYSIGAEVLPLAADDMTQEISEN